MEYLKKIKETILAALPSDTMISSVELEGPEVAIYTKNPKAFFQNENYVAKIASELKKRVNIRTDKSLLTEPDQAKEKILAIIPKEADVKEIMFDVSFSEVVIEAIKPGLVIGKGGETSKRIIMETGWTPKILRAPTSPSEILKGIRYHLHKYSNERKKILQETAKKIYGEQVRPDSWVRLTALGSFQEVGRSCILVETRDTKVMMDCGINVASFEDPYPYLDALRFPINELDALIISHAHLDHTGFAPYLYKLGYRGPLYCTEATRDLMALLQFDYIDVLVKEGREPPYTERDVKEQIKHCITRDYREVTDIAPDMRLTFHNAAHILGSASVHLHIGEGGHNLVYSLDWNTPVTVFDKNNKIHVIELGKLVDKQVEKYGLGTGFVEQAENLEGWKTIAFNPQTLKSELVGITSFIRHPINEDLLEIRTRTGRKTTVTGSHSIFSVKNGEVLSVKAKDLNLGDYIAGSKKLQLEPKEAIIKLPENKFALKFSGEKLESKLKYVEKKAKKIFPKKYEMVMGWARLHYAKGLYANAIAKKYKIKAETIRKYFEKLGIKKNPRVKNAFPHEIKLNEDIARFIGYFVSEGSLNKNTVIITQYKKNEMLRDSLKIIKENFGIQGKIVENEAHFYSKQLKIFLKTVLKCGDNAYIKRIPSELALAPKNVISGFLHGYYLGDGEFRIRSKGKGVSINCSSKSKILLQEVAFLLLRLGITPTFGYDNHTKIDLLYVNGKDQLKTFIENVQIEEWKTKLQSVTEYKTKSHFANKIPIKALSEETIAVLNKTPWQNAKSCGTALLMKISKSSLEKKLVESDLMLDEIVSIRKVKSTSKFVYDLSVNGYENFMGGFGHLFMHNSADIKYGFTRLFDMVDNNYPRLETLILESTYGAKEDVQPPRQDAEQKLVNVINEGLRQNGNILIPVFSVGRAQEIMLVIENAYRHGMLEEGVRVYVDGMTKEASAIHTAYPEYLRKNVEKRVLQNDSPFTSPLFQVVETANREAILQEGKAVIVASSGMLTGGPSVHYLHRMADDPRNTLIFVGYQGEGSVGRKIQGGVRKLPIVGENGRTKELNLNLRVETVEGFSGHSPRPELTAYVKNLHPKPKRILVNHGDRNKTIEFSRYLSLKFQTNATAIKNLETVRLK